MRMNLAPLVFALGLPAATAEAIPMVSLPSRPARRWKGRRTSKYMPHEGVQEVARRRRQRLKIEARKSLQLAA